MSDVDAMIEEAARALAPLAWAALGSGDTIAHRNRRKASLRHARAALESLGLPLETLAALRAGTWQAIETPPTEPTKLLFYFAKTEWRDLNDQVVEIPDIEAMRYGIGYWDGCAYRGQCTNHDVFEFSTRPVNVDKPTHWMPLPAAPTQPKDQP